MNMRREKGAIDLPPAVQADVSRIEEIWRTCREAQPADGPFLFGRFTAADAMFAPVVNRFEIYAVPVSPSTRGYMDAVMALPAWQAWRKAADGEEWVIPADEV